MTVPGGPTVVSLEASPNVLAQGATTTLLATVTDPDGPQDILGGSLKTADGSGIYGAFVQISEGGFTLPLTWSQLDATMPIAPNETTRTLRAEFLDGRQHLGWSTVDISFASSCDAQECTYPSGPYGVDVNSVLPPTLTWSGFAAGSQTAGDVSVAGYHDCDGVCDTNAILFASVYLDSGPSEQEAQAILAELTGWTAQGIRVVFLVVFGGGFQAPTIADAEQWRRAFSIHGAAVLSDPNHSMYEGSSIEVPLTTIVDPRTMRVVERQAGWGGSNEIFDVLESLAAQNDVP